MFGKLEEFGLVVVDSHDEKILSLEGVYAAPTPNGLVMKGDVAQALFVAGRCGVVSYYSDMQQYGFLCRIGGIFGGQTVYWMFDDCYEPTHVVAVDKKELEGQRYARVPVADYLAVDFKRIILKAGTLDASGNALQRLMTFTYHVQRIAQSYPTTYGVTMDFGEPDETSKPRLRSCKFWFVDESSILVDEEGLHTSSAYTCGVAEKEEADQVELITDSLMSAIPGRA